MGCTQSKIETEEAVARCKERRQLMRLAVASRNAFAAAHSSYAVSLKNTGAALSDFAQGESLDPRPIASHPPSSSSSASVLPSSAPQAPIDTPLPPPPPPLPDFSPAPLHRSASMPDLPVPKPKKPSSDPSPIPEDDDAHDNPDPAPSPSPSPPPPLPPRPQTPAPPPPEPNSPWDYFFSMDHNISGPSLAPPGEEFPPQNQEIEEEKVVKNAKAPVVEEEPVTPEKVVEEPPPPPPPAQKVVKKVKQGGAGHHQHAASVGAATDAKRGKIVATVPQPNVSLVKIFNDLDDHFLKASESAHEVSKMLEATRLHYHSNFADNRGHIDHSARVMRVITWNRSLKGIRDTDVGNDDFDNDEGESHATVLDKMLAWEKKLYDEVKAGELMKIEYQRKVALLSKQRKRGTNPEALERTKAAVSHLHTRYIVDMQSLDSTVSEINRLRDHQLYPKLVDLVDEMAKMWETMHAHHDSQFKIVARDLRALDISHAPKETSEQHYDRTVQLLQEVREWHSQLQKLMAHQKEYIQTLNSWLKLNLIPIESSLKEKVSSPPRVHKPPIQPLLHAWHDQLDKLPDELAKNAIFSFSAIVAAITTQQQEELRLKEKCEELRKEYVRKVRAFEDWCHKYSQKKAAATASAPEGADLGNGEGVNQNDPLAERKFAVEALESRLKDETEVHQKACKQVREKSLASLRSHLPELFRTMSDFALACSEMYKKLRSINQSEEPSV